MKRSFAVFGGMMPGIAPDQQPPEAAESAVDLTIEDGMIRRVATDLFVVTPAKVGTKVSIYKFGRAVVNDTDYWFHWLNDTDVARIPALTDVTERTVYTEATQVPKITDNSIALGGAAMPFASYNLGLPSPAAVTIAASGATDPPSEVSATVVITFVTGWGEEGPPSLASNQIQITNGQLLTITGIPGAPAGAYNVVTVRIYVAAFNSQGTGNFKFFKSVAIGTATTNGTFQVAQLIESLQAPYLLAPPADLFGIGAHPGKFLFGFSGRNFCRSEINRAHGWPAEYVDPMGDDIIGGALIGSSVVICTRRGTFFATGTDPGRFAIREIITLRKYPCISKRSICLTDDGVAYASSAGLVIVGPDGSGALITRKMIGVDAWRAYKPSSFTSVFHRGYYMAFYNTGAVTGSIVLDMVNKTLVESTLYATAAWSEPALDGALYLQVGADIVKWRAGGAFRTPIWRSPKRQLDTKHSWGAGRVVAEVYGAGITLKLIQDGTTTNTKVRTSRKGVTLAPVRAATYQVEVSGGDQIKRVDIASSVLEFQEPG